jgi:hypothetical protein
MPVPAYTDLFNVALDDLTATLTSITGLTVTNDPRSINPPCAFIDAPSFVAFNFNIVEITFPVRLITLGPGNLDAQRSLMNMASQLLAKNVAVTGGRPTVAVYGGAEYAAYDLTIDLKASTTA